MTSTVHESTPKTFFAPHLTLRSVLAGIEYYKSAFDANELRRWSNSDGSVHVAEMEIGGALFHLHEETLSSGELSPETLKGVTSLVGIFVSDPDSVILAATSAGGHVCSQMQDYDYGYRQGTLVDPFGHKWLIQKKIAH